MQLEQLLQDYKNKVQTQDLMKKYSMSWNKLTRILKENNVYVRNNSLGYSDEILLFIKENYSIMSNKDIALKTNISEDWLRVVAKRLNLVKKGSGWKYNSEIENFNYNTNEFSYFLGWMASDGNISKNLQSVSLSLTDKDIILKFKNEMFTSANIYKEEFEKQKTLYKLYIGSKKFSKELEKFGIVPAKTYNLNVPEFVWNNHFVRGFFEGDGHVRNTLTVKNTKRYEAGFVTASEIFCNQLCSYLKNNNIDTVVSIEKKCFRIRISGKENLFVFYRFLYKDCNNWYLIRKKQILDQLFSNE